MHEKKPLRTGIATLMYNNLPKKNDVYPKLFVTFNFGIFSNKHC
ncbi:hypothetical protein ABIE78_004482 [Sinorhizobium fredii]